MNLRVFFATLCFAACFGVFVYMIYLFDPLNHMEPSSRTLILLVAVMAILFALGMGIVFGG